MATDKPTVHPPDEKLLDDTPGQPPVRPIDPPEPLQPAEPPDESALESIGQAVTEAIRGAAEPEERRQTGSPPPKP